MAKHPATKVERRSNVDRRIIDYYQFYTPAQLKSAHPNRRKADRRVSEAIAANVLPPH